MINHIISNDTVHIVIPRVILRSVADHYTIMFKISKIETLRTKPPVRFIEIKKDFHLEAFANELDQKLGELVSRFFPLNLNNFDDIFDQFVNIIAKTIDKHAPLERIIRKQRKLAGKPWITKRILTSIRKKINV